MTNYFKYHFITIKRRIAFNYTKWVYSFIGSFVSISAIFIFHHWLGSLTHGDTVMLIGSFGASAIIIFGTPNSPYALPRHAIGGHIISALIGVLLYKYLLNTENLWICCALAVALSLFIMQLTHTTHPPGGATALIAVIGTSKVHSLGFWFLLSPIFSGILILLGTSTALKLIVKYYKLIIYKS